MGLVAREAERRGIATVSLSSAYSITAAVNPPRAVFVDFPLGHTAGKPGDRALQRHIMIDTLSALDGTTRPGAIRVLPYTWDADDAWKRAVASAEGDGAGEVAGAAATGPAGNDRGDDRVERSDQPQYQFPEDRDAAERR